MNGTEPDAFEDRIPAAKNCKCESAQQDERKRVPAQADIDIERRLGCKREKGGDGDGSESGQSDDRYDFGYKLLDDFGIGGPSAFKVPISRILSRVAMVMMKTTSTPPMANSNSDP